MSTALSTYSLLSLEELKEELRVNDDGKNLALTVLANTVSVMIESYLGRQVVTRGALTEYHTMEATGDRLWASVIALLDWPIISVTSIHEDTDWPRTYGASYLLAAGTDYQTNPPTGRVYRLTSPGAKYQWATGFRAIKVVYSAGYATTAAVPQNIKAVARRLAGVMWEEYKRDWRGVSSVSDQIGNFTRFSAATLSADMKADLASERRMRVFETGERDS